MYLRPMNQDIKSLKALLKRARYQETVYQCYRMNRKDNEIIEHTTLNKHFLRAIVFIIKSVI